MKRSFKKRPQAKRRIMAKPTKVIKISRGGIRI